MEKGTIIFLNGTSSAGKSTLAKSLQEELTEPYFLLDGDGAVEMLAKKFQRPNIETVLMAFSAMHHTAKLYSDMGINTIVVQVCRKPILEECVKLLHENPVLFVHVICPIEELRHREKERGNRPIGLAEDDLITVVPKDTYDITVDTSKNNCVDEIIRMLSYPEKFTAFKTLWSQRTV